MTQNYDIYETDIKIEDIERGMRVVDALENLMFEFRSSLLCSTVTDLEKEAIIETLTALAHQLSYYTKYVDNKLMADTLTRELETMGYTVETTYRYKNRTRQ